ncbi:MAG: peptidase E, partial [Acidobacteria bacterium]|nr:peptidase E [Acidobacteriota bacterium]
MRLAVVTALALMASMPAIVSAHKFYMSLTVADHNATEKSLEFTIRLFADDLE